MGGVWCGGNREGKEAGVFISQQNWAHVDVLKGMPLRDNGRATVASWSKPHMHD